MSSNDLKRDKLRKAIGLLERDLRPFLFAGTYLDNYGCERALLYQGQKPNYGIVIKDLQQLNDSFNLFDTQSRTGVSDTQLRDTAVRALEHVGKFTKVPLENEKRDWQGTSSVFEGSKSAHFRDLTDYFKTRDALLRLKTKFTGKASPYFRMNPETFTSEEIHEFLTPEETYELSKNSTLPVSKINIGNQSLQIVITLDDYLHVSQSEKFPTRHRTSAYINSVFRDASKYAHLSVADVLKLREHHKEIASIINTDVPWDETKAYGASSTGLVVKPS